MTKSTKPTLGLINTDEFIAQPSTISKTLIDIVNKHNSHLHNELSRNQFFHLLYQRIKISIYLKQGWHDYFIFLKNYSPPKLGPKNHLVNIKILFSQFDHFIPKMLYNNYALAYTHLQNREVISCPILTKEDEKILLLAKYANQKITKSHFTKKFGHYALNPYELSSKRFSEYSDRELMEIAKLAANINHPKKTSFNRYLKLNNKNISPILIYLRELAKYKALFLVSSIRQNLLTCQRLNKINNVFDLTFKQLKQLNQQLV